MKSKACYNALFIPAFYHWKLDHLRWHFRDSTVALLSALSDNRFVKIPLCKREGGGQKQTFHSDSELSHW